MKKILFLAFVVMLCSQTIDAQCNDGNKRAPEQMVERLDKKLNLTDEQEKQIKNLYTDFFSQKVTKAERKTKKDELDSKIISLLTDEQKAEYEKMKSEMQKKSRK